MVGEPQVVFATDNDTLSDLARTYGLRGYYLVSPIGAQRVLVERILEHWRSGAGARRIPERGEALRLVSPVASIDEARVDVAKREGQPPRVVLTGAAPGPEVPLTSYAEEAAILARTEVPTLLLFGTGHGLAPTLTTGADAVLAPIRPGADYNHLSVRAAAAITLDRLLGDGPEVGPLRFG